VLHPGAARKAWSASGDAPRIPVELRSPFPYARTAPRPMDGSAPSPPRTDGHADFRVALVTPAYGSLSSGPERHVRELARGIVRAGGRAEVLTEVPRSPGSVLAADDGVVVHGFRPASGTQGYAMNRDLWGWLAAHAADFDVVHAHGLRTLPVLRSARIEPR